jgi:hypothetical protein
MASALVEEDVIRAAAERNVPLNTCQSVELTALATVIAESLIDVERIDADKYNVYS